jgi:hypothetical protein
LPAAAESIPPAKTKDASDGQGRKSAAKPKTPQHAAEEAKKKNLAKLVKGTMARRIVKELTSRGGTRTIRGKARVRQEIRRLLNQNKAQGGSGSEPSKVTEAVRELLNQAAK